MAIFYVTPPPSSSSSSSSSNHHYLWFIICNKHGVVRISWPRSCSGALHSHFSRKYEFSTTTNWQAKGNNSVLCSFLKDAIREWGRLVRVHEEYEYRYLLTYLFQGRTMLQSWNTVNHHLNDISHLVHFHDTFYDLTAFELRVVVSICGMWTAMMGCPQKELFFHDILPVY